MSTPQNPNRREFLQAGAAGIAAVGIAGAAAMSTTRRMKAASRSGPWARPASWSA